MTQATAGSKPFPAPISLPDGEVCANFNQLALACQRKWKLARDLLVQGIWQSFFQGLNRPDLAEAARQAAQTNDPDRALSEFLGKFPADSMQPPKLSVQPARLNLGTLKLGNDYAFKLTLANQGMLLLQGEITAKCDWLAPGSQSEPMRCTFQTPGEMTVTVRVLGKQLRAGATPLQGELLIQSNGGSMSVNVRAEIPAQPFPTGILAGATTPEELAAKARTNPQEAGLLFEQGAVKAWYQANGWLYPIERPADSGLGAVQQYFEVTGLTRPPALRFDTASFAFFGSSGARLPLPCQPLTPAALRVQVTGQPGERVSGTLAIATDEKRPIFAFAASNQPWLIVRPVKAQGAVAQVPVEIAVPPQPGATVQGKVVIEGNGKQRFEVDVAVTAAVPAPMSMPMPMPIPVPAYSVPAATYPVAVQPAGVGAPYAVDDKEEEEVFGMTRLVYWGAMLGGWSALVGWAVAELLVGRWVENHAIFVVLMVMIVSAVLGAGLSQVGGLTAFQARKQLLFLGPGLLGGLIGGLIGGLFGNFLFTMLGDRFALLVLCGRILGWVLLGIAIGICEGVLSRDWRRIRNGLIGGTIGGFLGGLLFDPLGYLVGSPVVSRAFAFVAIGLCIGLFISLVEVLLKEAWLTVEGGFRPGRQLILKQSETTLGTSEKAGLIFIAYGAKGVEPVHVKVHRDPQGVFFLEDCRSRTGTLLNGAPLAHPTILNDGDLIQFGVNRVRFNIRLQPHRRS